MQNEKIYRHRLRLSKKDELEFISHLDWQNLILKIFRRLELKLVLSEGFNKMPKVSYSPALPLFMESVCELVNFQTYEPLGEDFAENFKKYSPDGIELIKIEEIKPNEPKSLENYIQWAQYEAVLADEKKPVYNFEKIRYIIDKCLSSDELFITKKTKKGIEKTINYRNSLKEIKIAENGVMTFVLKAGQHDTIPALRADDFLKALFEENNVFRITRVKFFDTNLRVI